MYPPQMGLPGEKRQVAAKVEKTREKRGGANKTKSNFSFQEEDVRMSP